MFINDTYTLQEHIALVSNFLTKCNIVNKLNKGSHILKGGF